MSLPLMAGRLKTTPAGAFHAATGLFLLLSCFGASREFRHNVPAQSLNARAPAFPTPPSPTASPPPRPDLRAASDGGGDGGLTDALPGEGLIVFWDFQPGPGRLTSRGPHAYILEERNGKIASANEGIFGPGSIDIDHSQWLRIKREDAPALNLTGRDEVSIVTWIKPSCEKTWQFLAGIWDERERRQYGMFVNATKQTNWKTLERVPAENQVHGYVSDVGGATPGKPFSFSYGSGKMKVRQNEWTMVAYTYDHSAIRVYKDGELDVSENHNPFEWDKPIFDPGKNGGDFTVGHRAVHGWKGYPDLEVAPRKNGFCGLMGGLAVYKSALSGSEIRGIYEATMANKNAPRDD